MVKDYGHICIYIIKLIEIIYHNLLVRGGRAPKNHYYKNVYFRIFSYYIQSDGKLDFSHFVYQITLLHFWLAFRREPIEDHFSQFTQIELDCHQILILH